MKKRFTAFFLSLVLILSCLGFAACGKAAPEGLTILVDDEPAETLELLNGTEQSGVRAELSPSDYDGEITWTSEDSGIVKVTAVDGNTCTLTAKKTGSTKITAECNGVSASFRVHVLRDPDNPTSWDAALTVKDVIYTPEMCNLYFAEAYYQFLDVYGDYAAAYGLDSSLGVHSLTEQACDYSDDGTWYGYFIDVVESQIPEVQALCDYADSNGITLSDEDRDTIEQVLANLPQQAADAGCDSVEDYLTEYYGEGVTEEMYRKYLEDNALADEAYSSYANSLTYSDEEIAAHYEEIKDSESDDDYPVTVMRHILILAEADEDGNYSDEAIAAAHEKAEEIYKEWKAGDRTEESFAALANEYSDDTGSNTDGGLYEDIYKNEMIDGINDWLFASGRAAGDTTIVDNNGSYVGTHIVYFVGYGDTYANVLSLSDLKSTDVDTWYSALTAGYTCEEGPLYSEFGACFQ